MIKSDVKYRRAELEKQAGRLLNHDWDRFKKMSQNEQGELHEILLELIGLDIKISSPDPDINNGEPVPRTRRKKKHGKKQSGVNLRWSNQQLILTF